MIVYELACTNEHRFEGWFASAEDYARQRETSLLRCPLCDDAAIERRPSANVQIGRAAVPAAERSDKAAAESNDKPVVGGEAEVLKLLRRLVEQTENVGAAFPEEARKIHYDEAPHRAIRGQATADEADALRDEGIDFMSLPSVLTRDLH
jgi:hypothetical protein